MKCVSCRTPLDRPFKTIKQRIGIRRGSTRYTVKEIYWCKPCWTETVRRNEKSAREADERIAQIAKEFAAKGKGGLRRSPITNPLLPGDQINPLNPQEAGAGFTNAARPSNKRTLGGGP